MKLHYFFLWLLLCGFTHVQGQSGYEFSGTADATFSLTLPGTVTSGNMVACFVGFAGNPASSLASFTDDKSNAYNVVDAAFDVGDNRSWISLYLTNITNTPQTLTANFSPSMPDPLMICDEYSGVAAVSPLDGHTAQHQAAVGTGTDALTSGSITTTVNGDLIYAAELQDTGAGATVNAGTAYTLRQVPITGISSEDKTQATAGAVAGTFTTTASGNNFITGVMAFKPSGGGSTPAPPFLTLLKAGAGNPGHGGGGGGGGGRLWVGAMEVNSNAAWTSDATWPAAPAILQTGTNGNGSQGSFMNGPTGPWNPAPKTMIADIQLGDCGQNWPPLVDMNKAKNGSYNSCWLGVLQPNASNPVGVARLWQEINGNWFPWSTNQTGATVSDGITSVPNGSPWPAAWIKAGFCNLAAQVRAVWPNVKIDWGLTPGSRTGQPGDGTSFDLYPGDSCVDIVDIDFYEPHNGFPSPNLSDTPGFAQAHNKLFAIGETATGSNFGVLLQDCDGSRLNNGVNWVTTLAALMDSLGSTAAFVSWYDFGPSGGGGDVLWSTNTSDQGCPAGTLRAAWNASSLGTKSFSGTWLNPGTLR
jgi:hypothetical protein